MGRRFTGVAAGPQIRGGDRGWRRSWCGYGRTSRRVVTVRLMRTLLLSVTLALAAMGAGDLPVVEPQQVAGALEGPKPAVLYVGPNVLYRSKHIPGAIYAG